MGLLEFMFMAKIVTGLTESYIEDDSGRRVAFTSAGVTTPVVAGVTGDVTGDVTGNVTGDVTGNVTGNVTGDLTGDVTADSVATKVVSFGSGDLAPAHAKPATADFTYLDQPSPDDTMTFGVPDQDPCVFKFVVTVADDWDVKIGTTMDATYQNLVDAINMQAAYGVGNNQAGGNYKVPHYLDEEGAGTAQPWATLDAGNDSVSLECDPVGAWGNQCVMTKTVSGLKFSNWHPFDQRLAGADCTPGVEGDIRVVGDCIYLCTTDTQPGDESGRWVKVQVATAVS